MNEKEIKKVWNFALNLLSRREYTAFLLERSLLKRYPEAPIDVIENVLGTLIEKKYLSDERFAEVYIRSAYNRGWGANKIKRYTHLKGVSPRLVEEQMEKYDYIESALKSLQRKFGDELEQMALDYEKCVRIKRFLLNRGFGYDVITKAISSCIKP